MIDRAMLPLSGRRAELRGLSHVAGTERNVDRRARCPGAPRDPLSAARRRGLRAQPGCDDGAGPPTWPAAATAREGAQMRCDRTTPARGRRRRSVLRHGARGRGHGRGRPRWASRHLAGHRARHGRAPRRARERVDLAVVVDSETGIEALAAGVSADRPLGVVVEIDVGQGRTGVTRARRTRSVWPAASKDCRSCGIAASRPTMATSSTCRVRRAQGQGGRAVAPAAALPRCSERRGLPPEIVTGGGTGTHLLDLEEGPFTEIQPGSYLFMDKQYGAIELAPAGATFHLAHDRHAGDQRQSAGPRGARCRVQGDGDRRRPRSGRKRRRRTLPTSSWATSTAVCAAVPAPRRRPAI